MKVSYAVLLTILFALGSASAAGINASSWPKVILPKIDKMPVFDGSAKGEKWKRAEIPMPEGQKAKALATDYNGTVWADDCMDGSDVKIMDGKISVKLSAWRYKTIMIIQKKYK